MWSGRGICEQLTTRPEESYRVWCVVVCGLEKTPLVNEEDGLGPLGGYGDKKKKCKNNREFLHWAK